MNKIVPVEADARSLPEMFQQQVERTPDAVAIIESTRRLSYSQLDERANRFSNYLTGYKLAPGSPVGVLLPRSTELIVAILAILKSGHTYVPLDLRNPPARILKMISDVQMRLLITNSALAQDKRIEDTSILDLSTAAHAIAHAAARPPDSEVTSEDLAYLVFTSGSTGKPKAVMIPHRAFTRCERMARQQFYFTAQDRFLFKSIRAPEELFFPLLIGASLSVAPEGVDRDPALLIEAIQRDQTTVLGLTPSILRLLVDEQDFGSCTSLRVVLCSGELLSGRLASDLLSRLSVKLYNCYGLAEAPFTSAYLVPKDIESDAVSIGKSFDAGIRLLDANRQPVGTNEIGELYVSGPGLSRGYLGQAQGANDRFVSLPNAGQVLSYKTGDLARYDEESGYILTARADLQIKVRGFRLEPAEVEAVLRRHPTVQEACVRLSEPQNNGSQLIAQLTFKSDLRSTSSELRSFLGQSLPDYALPARYFAFAAFPFTTTGKLDRAGLSRLSGTELALGTSYIGPGNDVEKQLATIWEEVLEVVSIGMQDDFFDLGGNSLLASRVISRIRSALKSELPLAAIFEAPTIAQLAASMAGMGSALSLPLTARTRGPSTRLSHGQERLWFLNEMEAANPAYQIPEAWLLNGELDVIAFQRSVGEVIKRHEILRSIFKVSDEGPVQVVEAENVQALEMADLNSLPAAAQQIEIERQIKSLKVPFELGERPALRIKLLRLAPERQLLLVNLHHIIADEWSLAVFYRELVEHYDAFCGGKLPRLPPLPAQYADYSIWQRELLPRIEAEQLAYWHEQLKDLTTIQLPVDRPRPAKQSYKGKRHSFVLPQDLAQRLKDFDISTQVTPFMTLLSAFQILLSRYSLQDDIAVGVPVANRTDVAMENLIGFFVNMVVIRADLSGDRSFRQIVQQLRTTTLAAYEHQALPFERVVQRINPERDLSRHPLFQVLLTVQNAPACAPRFVGVKVSPYLLPTESTHFDLELTLNQNAGPWEAFFTYNTDLFDQATIERMSGHFVQLLDSLLAWPDQVASKAKMLAEGEEYQLLTTWNATATSYERDRCVHQLFEAQVEKCPGAIAIIDGDRDISYRELDERANQIAHHLQSLGISLESRVGISLERTWEMVAALLGTLKAGAAYVPIDPAYPRERTDFILNDAGISVLISSPQVDLAQANGTTQVITLEAALPPVFSRARSEVTPENLAYVIYTSGSTGLPKGVMIEHRNTVSLLSWARNFYSEKELAGVLASTSISFDLSVFEMFAPLTSGGTVILARDALQLPELSCRHQVTLLNTVPSATAELVRAKAIPKSVITVNTCGELLRSELVKQIYESSAVERVYDLYGPTEDTTYSTCALRTADEEEATIGRPLPDKQSFILDKRKQPVPIGVAGELYLGGEGVARGYLNRLELTAERFIKDPFNVAQSARLYRTGDLARFLADGRIEFLGRLDNQIKLRGFRIELGEIEAAILSHRDVGGGVVIVRPDLGEAGQLVGYITAKNSKDATLPERLRVYLQEKLPGYMVPSYLALIDAMPLTSNGKIDRKKLPRPEIIRSDATAKADCPRDELERQLSDIWSEALGGTGFGVESDFFTIGGHSLLAARVVNEINLKLGLQLSLAIFFLNSTIGRLAATIKAGEGGKAKAPGLVRYSARNGLPLIFCAPSIGEVERFADYEKLARSLEGEANLCGFESAPALVEMGTLAEHCVRLMLGEQPSGAYSVIGFCQAGHLAYEIGRRLEAQGKQVQLLALIDCSARNFAKSFRQRLFWLRERLFDSPTGFLEGARRRIMRRTDIRPVEEEDYGAFNLHHQVALRHHPGRYGGRLVLFNSRQCVQSHRSRRLGWDAFARKIDVHEIDCLHQELLKGIGVGAIAKKLRNYMSSSHSELSAINEAKTNNARPG